MHISSRFAKILGEKLFRTWEFPQSGSKAEDGGKKRKKEERKLVKTMAKLRMAHASTHGARKPPGPKYFLSLQVKLKKIPSFDSQVLKLEWQRTKCISYKPFETLVIV